MNPFEVPTKTHRNGRAVSYAVAAEEIRMMRETLQADIRKQTLKMWIYCAALGIGLGILYLAVS